MKARMSRFTRIMVFVVCLFLASSALAEFDFSTYSTDELVAMQNAISMELLSRKTSTVSDVNDFLYVSNGSEIRINLYVGKGGNVVIPEMIDGLPVTMLADNAFCLSYSDDYAEVLNPITNITLPKSIKQIGDTCFKGQPLDNCILIIPESMESIGYGAFMNTSLKGLVIDGDCYIDYGCFGGASLEFVYIRDGFSHPLQNAFKNNKNMEIAIIPDTVTSIDAESFNRCNRVTIITPSGSYAEQYAKENFIACDTASYAEYVANYEALYFPTADAAISEDTILETVKPTAEPTPTLTAEPIVELTPTPESTAEITIAPISNNNGEMPLTERLLLKGYQLVTESVPVPSSLLDVMPFESYTTYRLVPQDWLKEMFPSDKLEKLTAFISTGYMTIYNEIYDELSTDEQVALVYDCLIATYALEGVSFNVKGLSSADEKLHTEFFEAFNVFMNIVTSVGNETDYDTLQNYALLADTFIAASFKLEDEYEGVPVNENIPYKLAEDTEVANETPEPTVEATITQAGKPTVEPTPTATPTASESSSGTYSGSGQFYVPKK